MNKQLNNTQFSSELLQDLIDKNDQEIQKIDQQIEEIIYGQEEIQLPSQEETQKLYEDLDKVKAQVKDTAESS